MKDTLLKNRSLPIAIHDEPGSFSDGWIKYCEINKIPFIRVNCFDNDIVSKLSEARGLMWHWHHADPAAALFARQLTQSLESIGIAVFPNSKTAWHFDDKLGQKYLFESLNIPHVPSFAFYEKEKALDFVKSKGLPLVFKLTRGAGSMNVKLLTKSSEARRAVSRSFGRGWPSRSRTYSLKESLWHFNRDRTLKSLVGIGKGVVRLLIPNSATRASGVESSYVYFQEFVENNDSDIRVIVIGKKAFAIRRYVRDGDFRASGSGVIKSSPKLIPIDCIKIAYEAVHKMNAQVAALDFVLSDEGPLVVEVSYGFVSALYTNCEGFWDDQLVWHEAKIEPENFIIQEFIQELNGVAS